MLERYLLLSGVSEKRLEQYQKKLESKKGEELQKQVDDLVIHELRDVVEIRQLLKEEQWDYYDSLEIQDLREQLLLKEALRRLRRKFNEIVG